MNRDDDQYTQSILNWRARLVLRGDATAGPSETTDRICDLLLSDFPIDLDVRKLLVEAFDRGRSGARIEEVNEDGRHLPRIVVEGLGRTGEMSKAWLAKAKWWDAGEAVWRESHGRRADDVAREVGQRFGLGTDAMRNAKRFSGILERSLITPPAGSTQKR